MLGTSAGTYLPNTAIIVTAVPAAGYQFGGWRDDAKAATATHILILKSDTTLANICQDHNLSLSATDGGSVIGAKSGAYAEGTAVTVKGRTNPWVISSCSGVTEPKRLNGPSLLTK